MKKVIVIGIIAMFIGVGLQPAFANDVSISIISDDTTPPVSTYLLDPSEPDGCNGWYVSDVNVTLNATDDMSGVKEIKYRVGSEPIQTINGSSGTFLITQDDDGNDVPVGYWAIDYAGNEETPHKEFTIDMDQTKPIIDLTYEIIGGDPKQGWDLQFRATCSDATSGMEHVEFYKGDELQDTVYGAGPCYEWELHHDYYPGYYLKVIGLICNPKITDEYVKFFALIVIVMDGMGDSPHVSAYAFDKAGNWDYDIIEAPSLPETIDSGIYLFQSLTLPNDYYGHINRFFISVIVDYY